MRAHDEEMMTLKIGNPEERISLQDIAMAQSALEIYQRINRRRTYAFNITSDTLPDREETQS